MKDIEIWKTRFCGDDVVACLDEDLQKKFNKLPIEKQEGLIEEHAHSLGKGIEHGLMSDWMYIMGVVISNTSLESDIEKLIEEEK